ncbi:hypothetical protein [Dyella agri]|uniref:Pilus assembly protein n=1 Tax=Dyella agri TaxID=1926869 RepID=A0ABW8KEN5_9GAMM
MSRWKAATIHLVISLTLAVGAGATLYFLWFQPPWFRVAGASTLMLLLMGVDVCIGPLLTLLVADPRKSRKLLRLDLAIIATMQAVAFGYGIHVMAAARPAFIVAETDRFVLVAADEISDADLAQANQPAFRTRSWVGPTLVGAVPPMGDAALALTLQAISGGKDIDRLPKYYVPYDQMIGKFIPHAKTSDHLTKATPAQRRQLQQLQATIGEGPLLALPLQKRQRGGQDFTVILSPRTKKPVLVLALNAW